MTTGNIVLSGGTINLAATTSIHVGAGGTTVHTISSSITGAGTSLTKTGNSLTISGANSYTGSTIISSGTLTLGSTTALGSNPGVSGTSGVTIGGASAGILASSTDGITIAAPITTANTGVNSTISFSRSTSAVGSITLNGAIGGNGNVIFTTPNVSSGGNVQTINLGSTSNNYAGTTTLNTGNINNNLVIRNASSAANGLPTSTVLTFGTGAGPTTATRATTLDLNGQNQTLAGLGSLVAVAVPDGRNHRVSSTAAATLTINSIANQTFGGTTVAGTLTTSAQITGAISLVKNGTGTFTLGGLLTGAGATASGNAFTGSTKILGGILVLGESNSIQNSAFDTTSVLGGVSDGLRAGVGGTGVTTLTLGGLTGGNNFSTRFTSTTGGYTNLTNLTLNPGTGATPSYSGDVGNGAGTMTLTKSGVGTQTLAAAQTYSGGTFVSAGTLALSGTGTLGASGTALTLNGGSLDLGGLSNTVGAVIVTAAATGVDTILNGSLTGASYAASHTTGTAIISANLLANGAAGFALSGAGSVTLSGNNTYSGGTSVTSTGALNLQHSNAAGSNTISLSSTQASTGNTFTLSGGIDVANGIIIDASTGRENINSVSGSNTLSGNITINNSGNFIVFNSGGAAATTFTVGGATPNSTTITGSTYANTISFRANTAITQLGVINSQINAPNATLDLNNFGNWTINSTGNNWGTTQISSASGGVLRLGVSDALDTGALLNFSNAVGTGLLDMNGKNQQIAGVAGGNTTTPTVHISNTGASDSTLTLAGLTANRSFAGIIADGATNKTSLVLDSAGRTQTLSGTNTYTGATLVSAGTLNLNSASAINTSSGVTIDVGGTLQEQGIAGSMISDTAGVTVNGAFELDKNETIGGLSGSGTVTAKDLNNGNGSTEAWTLTVGGGNATASFSGALQDDGSDAQLSLTKTGTGTQTLTGPNTYTGTTTVSGGTLLINGNSSTANGPVNVTAGTLGGIGITGGAITVSGGATLAPGASIESLVAPSLSMASSSVFAYEVADNTATGADLLALSGTLSLTGVTLSLDALTTAALGGTWTMGNKLTLIGYTGTAITSGFTGYVDNTTYFFGANEWLFDYNDTLAGGNYGTDITAAGSNKFVTLTVVPEPNVAALIGALGGILLLRRRR